MNIFELEGASETAPLLTAYNRATGTWNLPKSGEFWEAVDIAVNLGRKGVGRRIAIIDSAFDVSMRALAKQNQVRSSLPGIATQHGTAVALLIHEVAPDATLDLFPVAIGGHIDSAIVQQDLSSICRSKVDIINISFGQLHDWDDVMVIQESKMYDKGFYEGIRSFALDQRGRLKVDTKHLPLCRAARTAVDAGKIVIAAAGNRNDKVYSPAIDDSVVSCGFQTVRRVLRNSGDEVVWSDAPSFEQSVINVDMLIKQPQDVLGSSFASPLIAGFAALMLAPNELPLFLESALLAGIASSVEPSLSSRWSPEEHGVVDAIYKEALLTAPHHHYTELKGGPCPECALFARPAYTDFGLFKLKSGDILGAEQLLRTVRRFAPADIPAAANLGVTLIEKEKHSQLEKKEAQLILLEAKDHFQFVVANRPSHEPYRDRLMEIEKKLLA